MYAKGTQGIRELGAVDAGLADAQRLMLRGVLESGNGPQREVDAELHTAAGTVDKALAAETAIEQSPQEQALVTRFQTDLASYGQARDEVRRLSRTGHEAAALKAYTTASTRYDAADAVLAQLVQLNADEAHDLDLADLVDLLELPPPGAGAPGDRHPGRCRGRVPGDPRDPHGRAAMVTTLRTLQDECTTPTRCAAGDGRRRSTRTVTADVPPIDAGCDDEIGDAGEAVNEIRSNTLEAIDSYGSMREQLVALIGKVARSAETCRPRRQQMASTSEEAGRAVGEIADAVGDVAAGAERQVRDGRGARAGDERRPADAAVADEPPTAAVAATARRPRRRRAAQATEAMAAVRELVRRRRDGDPRARRQVASRSAASSTRSPASPTRPTCWR